MHIEKGNSAQRLLATRYNRPIDELPTYTKNKYHFIGRLLPNLITRETNAHLTIVELGCGNKGLAETYILSALEGKDVNYIGIDSNPGLHPSPTLVGDIAATSLASSSADALLCLDVLEHINRKKIGHVMEEMVRVAKPGAPIIISVPSMYNLDRFNIPSIHFGTHVTKQTPHEWQALIENYILVNETMGLGVFEIIPYLPQFLKMVNPDFPMEFITTLYKALKSLDLGRLDPSIYKAGLNRTPHLKEYCDSFLMIGQKKS